MGFYSQGQRPNHRGECGWSKLPKYAREYKLLELAIGKNAYYFSHRILRTYGTSQQASHTPFKRQMISHRVRSSFWSGCAHDVRVAFPLTVIWPQIFDNGDFSDESTFSVCDRFAIDYSEKGHVNAAPSKIDLPNFCSIAWHSAS